MKYTPLVERDDIRQEAELRRLAGVKKPSQSLIRKELNRRATQDPSLSEAVLSVIASPTDTSLQDRLVDWASTQSAQVEEIVSNFLDDPDSLLAETVQNLQAEGILLHKVSTRPSVVKRVTYTSILKRALPATQDELVEALSHCPITRPASTVRQFLRRHGPRLEKDAFNQYYWKEEEPIQEHT